MSMLEINDIHVYIHSFYILHGISLQVRKGETTVLLGRNGAGKTTCMRAILGLNPPKTGTIFFKGEDISRLPTHEIIRKGIGYVPDTRRIFKTLTVEQNLIISQRKSSNDRIEVMYNLFPDLGRLRNHKAGALSGGQQQMLAVARALINKENELLLIDEPTEGLSPIIAKSVMNALDEIKAMGKTILLVEQNFKAATVIGDKYYIFDDGHVAQNGEMASLVENEDLITRYLGVKV